MHMLLASCVSACLVLGPWFPKPPATPEPVPISKPTVIKAPGHYVVVAPVLWSEPEVEQPAIVIDASKVTLDLNGFEVNGIAASDVFGLSISGGIVTLPFGTGIDLQTVRHFRIQDVTISASTAINVNGGHAGLIERASIGWAYWGIHINDGISIEIRGNVLQDTLYGGILVDCNGCVIADNMDGCDWLSAQDGKTFDGPAISIRGRANLVRDNLISDVCDGPGLSVDGYSNRIVNNHIVGPGSSDECPRGFHLGGRDNFYSGNSVQGFEYPPGGCSYNECPDPSGNWHFCDTGVGNVSADNNFMPGKM